MVNFSITSHVKVMKNGKKITRLRLEDNHTDDYVFMGLVSAEPDYKLSLFLNKRFRTSLKHATPVKSRDHRQGCVFSRFSTSTDHSAPSFSLIANRCEKEYLLKKLKNVDFIFVSHDPEKEIDAEKLSADLRSTESVTAVFRIDPGALKDKNIQYLIP